MSKKIQPLSGITLTENRILIKKHGKIEKTEGGIILPEDQQMIPDGGIVVAVGPEADPKKVAVGFNVLYQEHGREVDYDGECYYLLRDTDVWARIK